MIWSLYLLFERLIWDACVGVLPHQCLKDGGQESDEQQQQQQQAETGQASAVTRRNVPFLAARWTPGCFFEWIFNSTRSQRRLATSARWAPVARSRFLSSDNLKIDRTCSCLSVRSSHLSRALAFTWDLSEVRRWTLCCLFSICCWF